MMNVVFREEVKQRSGQNIDRCYQCLKCTVGCPMSAHFEHKPNSLIRMIQYDKREQVLASRSIWLCVSCMTCAARCPNQVDMSVVMDTLREMAVESGAPYGAEKNVVLLHEEFIRSIRMWGRLHEVTFFMAYMLRSFDFFSPIPSGVTLFAKGKLPLVHRRIKGIKGLQELFNQAYGNKKKAKGEQ
jgi:heterodisulfide reductase subunit C